MKTDKFIEALTGENFAFVFDPKTLKDRFMSYATQMSTSDKPSESKHIPNTMETPRDPGNTSNVSG